MPELFGPTMPIWPPVPSFGPPLGYFQSQTTPLAVGVTAPMLLNAVALRRGQPLGPTTDQEVEDFIYDALELIPGTSEVEIRCDNGRAILNGTVPNKRLKRDVGEIAWSIPGVNDVQNSVAIATRRRSRSSGRENEPATMAARKQA
jgi:hypothetical protein